MNPAQALTEAAQEAPKTAARLYSVLLEIAEEQLASDPDDVIRVTLKKILSEVSAEARGDGKAIEPTRTKKLVLDILRQLGDAGYGRLFLGRRGKSTRFLLWPDDEDDAALIAALRAQQQSRLANAQTVKRQYALRRGRTVELRLPVDLTALEANKLATFILAMAPGA